MVAAVIGLGHTLGLTVIAEGVETPAQLARLDELGCDDAQGHLFARPTPPPAPASSSATTAAGSGGPGGPRSEAVAPGMGHLAT